MPLRRLSPAREATRSGTGSRPPARRAPAPAPLSAPDWLLPEACGDSARTCRPGSSGSAGASRGQGLGVAGKFRRRNSRALDSRIRAAAAGPGGASCASALSAPLAPAPSSPRGASARLRRPAACSSPPFARGKGGKPSSACSRSAPGLARRAGGRALAQLRPGPPSPPPARLRYVGLARRAPVGFSGLVMPRLSPGSRSWLAASILPKMVRRPVFFTRQAGSRLRSLVSLVGCLPAWGGGGARGRWARPAVGSCRSRPRDEPLT